MAQAGANRRRSGPCSYFPEFGREFFCLFSAWFFLLSFLIPDFASAH